MNILVVGVCDKPESTNTFMAKALETLGHNVLIYNYRTETSKLGSVVKMNEDFCRFVSEKRDNLDFIIFCKTDTLTPESLNFATQIATTFYFFMDPIKTAVSIGADKLAAQCSYASATSGQVVDWFRENGQPKTSYFIEGVDHSIYYPDVIEKIYDVSFIGSPTNKRKYYISELNNSLKTPVSLWGAGWPEEFKSKGPIYNKDLAEVINRSKIVLNFVHNNSFSDRLTISLACGAFVLSEYSSCIEDFYAIGHHLESFFNYDSLENKIKTFLNNTYRRNTIGYNGYRQTKSYTWEKTCNQIVEVVKYNE